MRHAGALNVFFFFFVFSVQGNGQAGCCSPGSCKSHAGFYQPAVRPHREQSAHPLQRAGSADSPALSLLSQSTGGTRICHTRDSPRHPAEIRGDLHYVYTMHKCKNKYIKALFNAVLFLIPQTLDSALSKQEAPRKRDVDLQIVNPVEKTPTRVRARSMSPPRPARDPAERTSRKPRKPAAAKKPSGESWWPRWRLFFRKLWCCAVQWPQKVFKPHLKVYESALYNKT